MFIFWLVLNWRNALSAIALTLLLVGAGFGYQSYRKMCEVRAHKTYIDVMREVNAEISSKKEASSGHSFESEEQKKLAICASSELFLAVHASSGLAASVLGFMSRALVGLGKHEDARIRMHQAVKACASSDLRDMYVFSAALMDLDSEQEDVKAQGLSSLKKLAQNESSSACDAALYRLGKIYWNDKNYQEARLWWGQLVAVADNKRTPSGTEIRSPWVSVARDKLSLIDYK